MGTSLTLARDVLGYAALVAGAILTLASRVKSDNLKDLKDRVAILENEREEGKKLLEEERERSRQQHIQNREAIANLQGQLETYKEIPLEKIADSLSKLSSSNDQILGVLKGSAVIAASDRELANPSVGAQTIHEQTVEHQTVNNKEIV